MSTLSLVLFVVLGVLFVTQMIYIGWLRHEGVYTNEGTALAVLFNLGQYAFCGALVQVFAS